LKVLPFAGEVVEMSSRRRRALDDDSDDDEDDDDDDDDEEGSEDESEGDGENSVAEDVEETAADKVENEDENKQDGNAVQSEKRLEKASASGSKAEPRARKEQNPSFVPRSSRFFLHDDRKGGRGGERGSGVGGRISKRFVY
jgi:hypothetical protein